jgi:Tfp pilus assembly protein PilF
MTPRTLRRLGRFLLAAVLFPAFTVLASGGPVSSSGKEPPKIEEIEKAGEALAKGKADEAFKLLQEAVKKNPTLPPARLMLARLYLSVNQEQAQRAGRAILEAAAAETPDHPEVYLTNGGIALADGRLTDVILNCQTALSLADQTRWTADQKKTFQLNAHDGLSKAFENRRDWANARTQFAALLEAEPKNGQLRFKLATALFFLDKPEDARAELVTAVRDDPTLNPPDVTIGRLWMMKGDFTKATEAMERAVSREANNARVHIAYADLLLQKGDVAGAKIHADIAAKSDAKNPDVQKTLGLVARCQKDLATAQRIFEDLLRASPADLFAADQLALVLVDQSDDTQRNRGKQLAEVNARQYTRSPEAAATLGYAYFRVRNLTDAGMSLNTGLQLSGGQMKPDTAYYLALVLNEQDKFENAKQLVEGALKSTGLFVYRKDAQELLDKLKKKVPDKPQASDKAKTPDKGKGG